MNLFVTMSKKNLHCLRDVVSKKDRSYAICQERKFCCLLINQKIRFIFYYES